MLFLAIWPLFALICLGYGLARRAIPDAGFWPAAERINYVLLFPALLIVNLAEAPLRDPAIARLGLATGLTILSASLVLWGLRRVRPSPAARFGAVLQGVVRFNTYLGLSITGSLLGAAGLARAVIYLAVAVPLVNVLSVVALSTGAPGPWRLVRPVATNPLILACAIGIALSLTGVGLPLGFDRVLGFLGQASLPLGLLCVGAALRPRALLGEIGPLALVSGLRLVAMPALGFAVAHALALGTAETAALVIFTAIPTATTAYVLTQQMGGDGRLMAGLVTAQTLLSVVTIPLMQRGGYSRRDSGAIEAVASTGGQLMLSLLGVA